MPESLESKPECNQDSRLESKPQKYKILRLHSRRFVKYGFIGGSAAVVNLGVFALCDKIFGIFYIISGLIAFVIATYWNFILARKVVFKATNHSKLKEGVLIYLVSALGAFIDIVVLYVCVGLVGLDSLLAKIIAIGVAFVFNFSLRNFVIYKE